MPSMRTSAPGPQAVQPALGALQKAIDGLVAAAAPDSASDMLNQHLAGYQRRIHVDTIHAGIRSFSSTGKGRDSWPNIPCQNGPLL
jgi:hypothetical protein